MGKHLLELQFDPGNIFPYHGMAFLTEHWEYRVSEDGRLYGRPSLEGAQVALIAGITQKDYPEIRSYLESDLKSAFDSLIVHKGARPDKGLHLVISLTDEEADRRGRNGLVTSVLLHIRHFS